MPRRLTGLAVVSAASQSSHPAFAPGANRAGLQGGEGHPCGDSTGGAVDRFEHERQAILQLAGIMDEVAKIDGNLHWHDLRRGCGSRLAERGVDVLTVTELLGRATIMMTPRYFATTTDAVGAAMRKAMGWKRETK